MLQSGLDVLLLISMPIEKVVGITAGVFTGASMLPQLVKIIQEKKASQVSVLMLIVLIIGLALWAWYGFLKEDWPIIVTNLFSLTINLTMIFLRFKYRHNKS